MNKTQNRGSMKSHSSSCRVANCLNLCVITDCRSTPECGFQAGVCRKSLKYFFLKAENMLPFQLCLPEVGGQLQVQSARGRWVDKCRAEGIGRRDVCQKTKKQKCKGRKKRQSAKKVIIVLKEVLGSHQDAALSAPSKQMYRACIDWKLLL